MFRNVTLDHTISLSRNIMNEKIQALNGIDISKYCGMMDCFRFAHSDIVIPIEHVGLGSLILEKSLDEYRFREKGADNAFQDHFEQIDHQNGHYLADILFQFSPKTLNWVQKKNEDHPLKFEYINGHVLNNYTPFVECKANDENTGDLREITFREGYIEALSQYVDTWSKNVENPNSQSFKNEVDVFMAEDYMKFQTNLCVMKTNASLTLGSQEQCQ